MVAAAAARVIKERGEERRRKGPSEMLPGGGNGTG